MSKKRKKPSRRPAHAWRDGEGGRAQPGAQAADPRPHRERRRGRRAGGLHGGSAAEAPGHTPWADGPGFGGPESSRSGFGAPGGGDRHGREDDLGQATTILTGIAAGRLGPGRDDGRYLLERLPLRSVLDAARPMVETFLATAWSGGWQPVELVWHTRRTAPAAAEELVAAAVLADAARLAGAEVHPRWADQLVELGATIPTRAGTVDPAWLHDAVAGTDDPIGAVCDLVKALGLLPLLQVLLPVPGRPDIALDAVGSNLDTGTEGIDPKVLARVRALLAKAEATTFEAEAQAFTAKAHDLMTRHSLEHAVVQRAAGPGRARPLARRLLIDDPYADPKSLLVQILADASRCRAVSHPGVQMSTVVGFEADVAAVEVLYTSLLVQAQTALQQLARSAPAGSRERSRGFRSSFLRGFAHRIGERLEEAGAATVADLDRESGGALVLVLVEREADVDEHMAQLFPRTVTRGGSRPTDALGYRAGADAAERAELPWAEVSSG